MTYLERLNREQESKENQLAVIGYIKLHRVCSYLASAVSVAEYWAAMDAGIREARHELLKDVNSAAVIASLEFLAYDTNWDMEPAKTN